MTSRARLLARASRIADPREKRGQGFSAKSRRVKVPLVRQRVSQWPNISWRPPFFPHALPASVFPKGRGHFVRFIIFAAAFNTLRVGCAVLRGNCIGIALAMMAAISSALGEVGRELINSTIACAASATAELREHNMDCLRALTCGWHVEAIRRSSEDLRRSAKLEKEGFCACSTSPLGDVLAWPNAHGDRVSAVLAAR